MQIEIRVPRPFLTLLLFLIIGGFCVWYFTPAASQSLGGENPGTTLTQAQGDLERERIRQAVLERREEILRYELMVIEDLYAESPDAATLRDIGEKRSVLLQIISDQKKSTDLLVQSLEQFWAAQGTAFTSTAPAGAVALDWPVAPSRGISAFFEDDSYKEIFHVDHHAIDIPVEQGSVVRAAADGVIVAAKDNGLGYSYVTIKHANDTETVYGHVSSILVSEGDSVIVGQPIARSGGLPGSPGAGLMTTGPHLHFAVKVKGVLADPLAYLPNRPEVLRPQ